jgi:polysaccharide export outer membrane protein
MVWRAILLVLTILAGTAVAQQQQNQNNNSDNAPRTENNRNGNAGTEAPTAAVDPRTYVIGAEDALFVRVWREPDFSMGYVVRPDGKITVPLIGDLQAAGLTPERLADQLRQALSEYINKPDVTVTVSQVNSKKYYITGEINRPGEFALVVPTKIFDALSNAGGFRDFANKKKIIIIRGADRIKFNYLDIIKGKNLDQNIFIENGDTIVVP